MVFDVYTVVLAVFGGIFVRLLTNPNIRCAEIIGEPTSDEQRINVFSMLALCKQ